MVGRQIKHFKKMKLPDDIEVIFMDDGSDPSLNYYVDKCRIRNSKIHIYPTGDTRPWTQACAKNLGARIANGEYLFMTDIDHILSREAIEAVYQFNGDKMEFTREYAILSNKGQIIQELEALVKYGFPRKHHKRKKFRTYKHTNTFAMRREIFWQIGGYAESRCCKGTHPTHDDLYLYSKYREHCRKGNCKPAVKGPVTYVFPAIARDPKKLFHKLSRNTRLVPKESEFQVALVRQSLDHLKLVLDNHSRVFYARFGDGDFRLMNGRDNGRHKASPELRRELIEAISIKNGKFIKAAVLGYPKEPGMQVKLFIDGSVKGKSRLHWLQRLAKKVTDERIFYNPIIFHYLSIHDPTLLKEFINTYIKPKIKMFVGGNDRKSMESFYGKIDYFVQTPNAQAYYVIDRWWLEVEKHVEKCEVVLPSVGATSSVVSKRLWETGVDVHCIDMGSINDVLENRATRGWIKRIGIEKLRRNLLGETRPV